MADVWQMRRRVLRQPLIKGFSGKICPRIQELCPLLKEMPALVAAIT